MKKVTCFAVLLLLVLGRFNASAQPQPNVVLIFTDDQGTLDASCYGSKDLITPNIDKLAREGVRFSQFYASSPLCSPSRAALLTGRYPHRAGVPELTSSTQGVAGMPAEEVTLAETMKKAGYVTGHIGKWHLGYTPETMPNAQGFDYSFGHMGGCIDNYSHFFYWNGPNRHDLWRNGREVWADGEYFPELMTREAEQFMEKHRKEPFFLYWAINTPHYPLQGEAEWREAYKHLPHPRSQYAASVSTTDEKIGRLLTKLETLGLKQNTIVVFMSDHGHSTEERTFNGGGNAGAYRGAKSSMFEGGIRVPAIISWPGHLPAGAVRTQLGTGTDWFPTVLELCKIPLPDRKLDGKSLVPVIRSEKAPSPHGYYHWQLRNQWAVREGDWKLIGNPVDTSHKGKLGDEDKLFLVNLKEDVSETRNVGLQHPAIVQRLSQIHENWVKQIDAPVK